MLTIALLRRWLQKADLIAYVSVMLLDVLRLALPKIIRVKELPAQLLR